MQGMTKRRRAREMALQMLFQLDLGGHSATEVIGAFDPVVFFQAVRDDAEADGFVLPPEEAAAAVSYAKSVVRGFDKHRERIDEMVRQQADNWRLERMAAVDRNVLRLAVYELLYEDDVPQLVVLDEAIELAKRYGSERSSQFVNGLLDGLLKHHAFPGTLT